MRLSALAALRRDREQLGKLQNIEKQKVEKGRTLQKAENVSVTKRLL
jgi:hypothetical protein